MRKFPGIFLPGKAVRALFACDPYFDFKHSAVLLYGRLLSPAAVAGVHALPQFLLLRVLVVVFLDGPGTVSGHLGHMEDDGSGIQLAGDESSRAVSRVISSSMPQTVQTLSGVSLTCEEKPLRRPIFCLSVWCFLV